MILKKGNKRSYRGALSMINQTRLANTNIQYSKGRSYFQSASLENSSKTDGIRSWIIASIILWIVAIGLMFHVFGYVANADTRTTTYVVKPGDTVWRIAESLNPDHDPRNMVDSIVSENDLDNRQTLAVGEILKVPMSNN